MSAEYKHSFDSFDVARAFENPPPKLDYLWGTFLAGTVGALAAPGGTGKSFWALEVAMAVSCSETGGDITGLEPVKTGPVAYFSSEDPPEIIHNRIHAIRQHLNPKAQTAIGKNLKIFTSSGRITDCANPTKRKAITEKCRGSRLIIFDTFSKFHTSNENDNGEMAKVICTFTEIATETGASLLFLHHVSKGSSRDGQAEQQLAARGASAIVNEARWNGFLSRMTPEESNCLTADPNGHGAIGEEQRWQFVKYGECKHNYGLALGHKWYQRHEGGVLKPVKLVKLDSSKQRRHREYV